MTDQIRPDWEAKLTAVRAAVARRANRRIVMRQVGDRLIPIGITSGRSHPPAGEDGGHGDSSESSGSRRSRRRQQGAQLSGLEQYVGMGGQDLEEVCIYRGFVLAYTFAYLPHLQLMIMEAMRLSLIDHEEQQRKDAEEKKKKGQADASQEGPSGVGSSGQPASRNSSEQATPVSTPQHRSSNSLSAPQEGHSRSSSLTRIFKRDRESPSGRSSPVNPPPFSTLNAAFSTSSTASAVLGSPEVTAPSTSTGAAVSPDESQNPGLPKVTPEALDVDSVLSLPSVTDRPGYDVLASSPESAVAREPLLPGNHSTTTPS